jgi:hypothetical protein
MQRWSMAAFAEIAARSGSAAHGAAARSGGFQRWGSSSSIRLAGWECTRVSTSVRYSVALTRCSDLGGWVSHLYLSRSRRNRMGHDRGW